MFQNREEAILFTLRACGKKDWLPFVKLDIMTLRKNRGSFLRKTHTLNERSIQSVRPRNDVTDV